jgi:uncharacterized membrane protein
MSDIVIRRVIMALAVIGFAIVNYLTYVHYFGLPLLCGIGGHGCEVVQSSKYSEIMGIPIVWPGVIGYALIFLLLLKERRLLTLLVSGVGFAFSVYLTYIGLVVIGRTCIWCLSSAVCMTTIFLLAGVRWVSSPIVEK